MESKTDLDRTIMKSVQYRLMAMLLVIFVIGGVGLWIRQFGSLEWLIAHESSLRDYVKRFPGRGWLCGLAIYTTLSLIPGTAGKSVVCGWLFGFWPAVVLVDVGLTFAATGGFLISRWLVRDAVSSRFGDWVAKLNRGLEQDGVFYLLMMRIAHVPFSAVNYGAGATSISFGKFCWTTALGLIPGTMIFVFVGTRIPTLATIAEKGVWQLFDPLLFAILAATVIFPLLVRLAMGRISVRKADSSIKEMDAEGSPFLGTHNKDVP